ncbi:MAG: glycosyltransferase family 4 protein [Nitrospinota bacterium]|nr:glycosyltransferase family 4 protein [Nitrospinota bacterium]
MDTISKPTVTLVLPEKDHGFSQAYTAAFSARGWGVNRVLRVEEAKSEAGLVVADFTLAAENPAAALRLSCAQLALDIHYKKEYASDPAGRPFHLLDNCAAIVHDHETRAIIRDVIRPVNCAISMIPYPATQACALYEGEPPRIFVPDSMRRHPWLDGLDVTPVGWPAPDKAPAGSFVAIPEYLPEAWAAVNWAMASRLPAVLPGAVSFQRTCFYGALLFDPASEEDFRAKISIMLRPAPAKPVGKTLRVAVVAPRHEQQTAGGAENHATRLAESFIEAGHRAEILTTRTTSMLNWNNDLPAGEDQSGQLPVRRFDMDNLDGTEHHRLGHMINSRRELDWTEQTEWMRRGIRSRGLEEYIGARVDDYDYFIFIPYLYGTAYWGSHQAPEKSLLIPCYHREPAAFAKILNQNAQWMGGILFNTAAEMKLAREELKIHNSNMLVVGEGVETQATGDAARFRAKYNLKGDFILYVGRFQREKGLEELLNHFKKYVEETGSKVTLALAGKGDMPVADDPAHNIRLLGFLPEQDKNDALAACSALALPSVRESFSIVMMEAWVMGRPVIANGRCDAAREHIFTCRGGLLYDGARELGGCVAKIVEDPAAAAEMGRRGREYALANFQWPKIVAGIVETLEGLNRAPLTARLGQAMGSAGASMNLAWARAISRFMDEAQEKVAQTTPLSEESIPEILQKVEDFSDIGVNYQEFSHRKAVGGLLSSVRGVMTRHLKVNYLDIMEGKQRAFNREAAALLRRLYERLKDGS